MVTANGKALRYSEDNIRVVDRVSKGVKAMKLKPDDSIAQMLTIDPKANPDILVVTEFGFGKRTNASEYRENSGRNGMGVATISKKNDR
ncbi:DNA gyrase C-terminal beta-propeller domain-containing protein, partial [Streptomyces europaeiscabiei]|uniref:DNA gyrase C-terminal beta-propeller domain-containing protein n=1 Tax=Streptomyces europaeiscabiei TaxID=146819 RepID=UPI0038F72E17